MREPARQHPPDQAEELPVRAEAYRCLRDRQCHQLRIADQRPAATAGRDPILVSEDVRCNDKGFQIRHLELLSRGDTWSGSPSSRTNGGSLSEPAVSHQPSSHPPPPEYHGSPRNRPVPPFLMDRPVLHAFVRELVENERVAELAGALP